MALLGYAILLPLIVIILHYSILILFRFIKKKEIFKKEEIKPFLINSISTVLLTFIFSLIVTFCFGDITLLNGIIYLSSVNLLIFYINPNWIYKKIINKEIFAQDNRLKTIRISLILLNLLLETFAFNARAYKSNSNPISVDFSSSSLKVSNGEIEDNKWTYEGKETSLIYVIDNEQIKKANSVRLDFVNPTSLGLKVTISGLKDNKLQYEYSYQLNPVVYEHNQLGLPKGDFDSYKFKFELDAMARPNIGDYALTYNSITLSSLTFDAPIAFHFSLLRFVLILLAILSISEIPSLSKKYVLTREENKSPIRKWRLGIIGGGILLFIGSLIYVFIQSKSMLSSYPLVNGVEKYDMYTQLFDAFKKGQVNIDLPYSATQKYWDHAYYNEKIYVYFGVWPVIFISFPFYFIFGKVPNSMGLEIIGFSLYLPFFFLLITELINQFDKKANNKVIGFLLFSSFFLSLSIMSVTYKRYWMNMNNLVVEANYHVPVIYGLMHTDAFLLFTILGYSNSKYRKFYFPLAGFSFASIIATRPNLALIILIAAPLFILPLIKDYKNYKKNLLDYLPMFGILLIGAILIMKYNKDRFDSVLEFGARYQHTVADMTNMGLNSKALLPGFAHYFFNPFSINLNTHFPFIYCTNPRFSSDPKDYSTYLNGGIGLLFIPAFFGMLLNPFVKYKKESDDLGLTLLRQLMLPCLIIFTMVNYALAGICPRYMIEPYHLATIASIIGFISFARSFESHAEIIVPIFFVLILTGVIITMNINFDPFDGLTPNDLNGLSLRIREIFNDFNTSPYYSFF